MKITTINKHLKRYLLVKLFKEVVIASFWDINGPLNFWV